MDYPVKGTRTYLSIIPTVTEPFCGHCARMRLTAEGRLRPCLHDEMEVDLANALRGGASDTALRAIFRQAAAIKPAGRGGFGPAYKPAQTARPMICIGG